MPDTTISITVDTGVAVEDITSANSGTASGASAVDVIIDNAVDKNQAYEALTLIRDAILREDVVLYTS